MKATVTSKGQITIPVKIRRRLKLEPGQVLEFDEEAPFLKATRVFDPGDMYGVIGACRDSELRVSSAEWLNETRGPVEMPPKKHAGKKRR